MKKFNPLKHIIFTNQKKIKPKLDHFTHEIFISLTKVSSLTCYSSNEILERKYEINNARNKENTNRNPPKTKTKRLL